MAVLDEAAVETRGRWKPYPEYRDSGLDWLGEVPCHWPLRRLKDVAQINASALRDDVDPDYELVYVDITGVDSDGQLSLGEPMRFEDAPSRARRTVEDGDTIISTVRTYLKAIAQIDDPPGNLVVSTGFAVLRPEPDLDPAFLCRLVQSQAFVDAVVSHSEGVGYPAIAPTRLACLATWVPPEDEQRAIVGFLDRETSRIDALIARKERLIELLAEHRSALIDIAFDEDSRVAPLRRALHGIEQGWSPVAEDRCAEPDEWGVIKLSAVKRGVFIPDEHKALPADVRPDLRLEVKRGDVLLTRANTPDLVGDVCVVDATRPYLMLSDLVYRLSVADGVLDRGFLKYFLLSPRGRYQISRDARGSSQSMVKVGQSHIRSWLVPTPHLSRQEEIVAVLDRETERIDALVAKVRAHIALLREYRGALISAAVTGKIDVRDEATA